MDREISTALGRLDRYLFRIKRSLRNDDLIVALSDVAELEEIARRLYVHLENLIRKSNARKAEDLAFVRNLPRTRVEDEVGDVKGDR